MDKKSKIIIFILSIVIIGLIVWIGCLSADLEEQKEKVKDLKKSDRIHYTIENARVAAYGVIDAAKLYYTESILNDTMKVTATGNDATKLAVSGATVISGTWNFDSATGTITLVDVVFGDYICNGTVNNMKCKKY